MILIWLIYVAIFNFSPVDLLSKTLSRKKRTDEFIPCDDGWFLFGEKCLIIRGGSMNKQEVVNWDTAKIRCNDDGGNLVTIQSKEELDFIFYFMLLDARHTAWIGLSDRGNSTHFAWSDGSGVNFTYWDQGQPSNHDREDCVIMRIVSVADIKGGWDDVQCSDLNAYICQKRPNFREKSQNPQLCSDEQGGGWKFDDTCYHVVMEMKTWGSAEKHCKDNYGGHLATVLDKGVDLYLDYILSRITAQLWIGMKITDGFQQKWASGWFVTYNRMIKHTDNSCVLRNNSTVWNTAPCSKKAPFICDTFKDPPVLKPPVNGSHCPEIPSEWIDLGGEYCYFFETGKSINWYEASYECKRKGGNLVSIHSKEENEMLLTFVKYGNTLSMWIGLLRQLVRGDAFTWSEDGSLVDYENWAQGEGNNVDEKCGLVGTFVMDWSDRMCTDKAGYICSVRKVVPNITETVETTECTCPTPNNTLLIGVSVCIHLVLVLLGALVYYFRSRSTKRRKTSTEATTSQNAPVTYRRPNKSQTEIGVKEEPQYGETICTEPHYETVY